MLPFKTQQPRVSWPAVAVVNTVWFCALLYTFVCTNALLFTFRRHTSDTRLLALVGSLLTLTAFICGPIWSYLSDRVWTPLGRRRPFILCGWIGAAGVMASIPFLSSPAALLGVAFSLCVLLSFGSPMEVLCMEVVPPAQRGRSAAIRAMYMNLAVLAYFQGLFPLFDEAWTFPPDLPVVGGRRFTGEMLIYITGSVVLMSVSLLLLLLVREVPVADASTRSWRELNLRPVAAARKFATNVFGRRSWLWIYLLFVCSNNPFHAAFAGMEPLLQVEQLGFSKRAVALLGLPSTLLNLALLLPFMGWYADRTQRFSYARLGAVAVLASAVALGAGSWVGGGPRTAPLPLPWLLGIGLAGTIAGAAVYLLGARLAIDAGPPAGARVRLVILSAVLQTGLALAGWWVVAAGEAAAGPSFTTWFLYTHIRSTIRDSAVLVVLPVVFDFIPRAEMGTVTSGMGFISNVVLFGVILLAGAWISACSSWFYPGQATNYGTGFLFQAVVGVVALAGLAFFQAAYRRGEVPQAGRVVVPATK